MNLRVAAEPLYSLFPSSLYWCDQIAFTQSYASARSPARLAQKPAMTSETLEPTQTRPGSHAPAVSAS